MAVSRQHFNTIMKRALAWRGGRCTARTVTAAVTRAAVTTDKETRICVCVRAEGGARRSSREVPMKNVATLHGYRIRTAACDIIIAFEPNTRTEGLPACLWLCVVVCVYVWVCVPSAAGLHDDTGLRRTTRLILPRDDLIPFASSLTVCPRRTALYCAVCICVYL